MRGVAYIALVVLFFEAVARLMFAIPATSMRMWRDEELSWRRLWVSRHTDDTEIYFAFDQYDPMLGWRSKPGIRDMQVFGHKVLNTNSKGLRGSREFAYGPHPEKPRIAILGDSFTFGDGVSDDETYSHFLGQMLPEAEILNLGIHGYGHDQMLISFQQEGAKYRPDIVVLGYTDEDRRRNLLQFRDFAKPKFEIDPDGEGLVVSGSPVPRPEDVLKWDWLRPRLLDVAALYKYAFDVHTGRLEAQMRDVTSGLLSEIASAILEAEAIPVFVFLPVGNEIIRQGASIEEEEFFFSFCREDGRVECLSARPRFTEKLQRGMRFRIRTHWAAPGHLTVAEVIHEYLLQHHAEMFPAGERPVRQSSPAAP